MLTNICMWSGIACASIISISLCRHNSLNIFPISTLNAPKIIFLRYFGAKTIWYWHFHLVCAKLNVSLVWFFNFNVLLLCLLVCGCQPTFSLAQRSFFCISYLCENLKFLTPPHSRGLSTTTHYERGRFCIIWKGLNCTVQPFFYAKINLYQHFKLALCAEAF